MLEIQLNLFLRLIHGSEQELLKMYEDFVVEKFDQKPPPYSASYATPTDPTPSPEEEDVITGEKVAKLLAKVCAESALLQLCDLCGCVFQGPYVYELLSIMVHSGSAICTCQLIICPSHYPPCGERWETWGIYLI